MIKPMRLGYWTFLETPRLPSQSARKLPRADKAWLRFHELFGCYRPTLIVVSLANLVQRLMPLILPVMIRFWLDPLMNGSPVETCGFELSAQTTLAIAIGVGLTVVALQSSLVWWIGRTSSMVGHRLVADIRVEVYEHLLRIPVRYVEKRGTGRILLRFIGDSDALRLWISRLGPMAAADQFIVVILVLVMFAMDAQLAMLVTAPILLVSAACYVFRNSLRQATRSSRNLQASFTGSVEERLAQLRQFKWLTAGKHKDESVHNLSQTIAVANSHRDALGSFLEAIAGLMASIGVLLVLWVGINRVWSGMLSTGQLVAFIWIGFQLNETLKRLATAAVASQKSWVSATRILHLLSQSAELGRGEKYLRRRWRGESLEIASRSGAGTEAAYQAPGVYDLPGSCDPAKLVEELLGFQKCRDLSIRIDDKSIDEFNIHQIRQLIGWVTVRTAVFSGTLKDNLVFDCAEHTQQLAAPPAWAEPCFSSDQAWARWLDKPTTRASMNRREADLALLSVFRSALRGAKIYVVEPDAFAVLPASLWQELAKHAMVLVGSNNSVSEFAASRSCRTFLD